MGVIGPRRTQARRGIRRYRNTLGRRMQERAPVRPKKRSPGAREEFTSLFIDSVRQLDYNHAVDEYKPPLCEGKDG